jgi:hypothetical protein
MATWFIIEVTMGKMEPASGWRVKHLMSWTILVMTLLLTGLSIYVWQALFRLQFIVGGCGFYGYSDYPFMGEPFPFVSRPALLRDVIFVEFSEKLNRTRHGAMLI